MIEGRIKGEALLHDCYSRRAVIRQQTFTTVTEDGVEIDWCSSWTKGWRKMNGQRRRRQVLLRKTKVRERVARRGMRGADGTADKWKANRQGRSRSSVIRESGNVKFNSLTGLNFINLRRGFCWHQIWGYNRNACTLDAVCTVHYTVKHTWNPHSFRCLTPLHSFLTSLFLFFSPVFTAFLCSHLILAPSGHSQWTVFPHFNLGCTCDLSISILLTFFFISMWSWALFPFFLFTFNPFWSLSKLPALSFIFHSISNLNVFLVCQSLSSIFLCSVSEMLPYHLPPPWSTSRPRLWRAPGPWSVSRASNSPSLTSPLRVLTTPLSPRKAWANCTQAQAAGATVGARVGSGGVRLEPPGTEGQGQADRGQIQEAGTTWWNRSATEGWTWSRSCKCHAVFYSVKRCVRLTWH